MLKGVNRQVVEIAQPESRYFEKILLFVKPEFSNLAEARLAREAEKEIPDRALPPQKARPVRGARVRYALRAALYAGAGAAALALLETLLK